MNVYVFECTDPHITEYAQYSVNVCVPLPCDFRLWGRKRGAGVSAQQETDSQKSRGGAEEAEEEDEEGERKGGKVGKGGG